MKLARAPLIVIGSVAASIASAADGHEGGATSGRRSLNLFSKSTKGSKSTGKSGKKDDASAVADAKAEKTDDQGDKSGKSKEDVVYQAAFDKSGKSKGSKGGEEIEEAPHHLFAKGAKKGGGNSGQALADGSKGGKINSGTEEETHPTDAKSNKSDKADASHGPFSGKSKSAKGTKSTSKGSKEAKSSDGAKYSTNTCGPSERRSWRDMTCDEQSRYLDVVKQLKNKGIWDDFVKVHAQSENYAHFNAAFLPWHRWFLHKYEEEVRKEGGCDMFLPYWAWEQDAGHECESAVFHPRTFGGYNRTTEEECCVDGIVNYMPTEFNPDPVFDKIWATGECLKRKFADCDDLTGIEDDDDDYSFADESYLLRLLTNRTLFGDLFDNSFAFDLENAPHAGPHNFLGGMMGNILISPSDPIFFLHHANVDRIWAIWQDYRGHDKIEVKPTSFAYLNYWHGYPLTDNAKVTQLNEPMTFDCTTASYWEDIDWRQASEYNTTVPPTAVRCPHVDFTIDGEDYPAPWQAYSTHYGPIQVTYKNDLLSRLLANFTGDDSWNNPQWIEIAEDTSSATPKCLETSPVQVPEVSPPVPPVDEENCPILSFARPELTVHWFELCEEMLDATEDELLAALNKDDCENRGNPMAASEEWLAENGMDSSPEDFDCIFD